MLGEVLILLGAAAMFAGLVCRKYSRSREEFEGRAEASVVDVVAGEPDDKGKEKGIHDYFYPVFAYYAGGVLIQQRYRYGSNPSRFYRGQKVSIRYKLSEPSSFVLEKKNCMEERGRLLHYAGLLLILAGGVIFILFANRKWLTL